MPLKGVLASLSIPSISTDIVEVSQERIITLPEGGISIVVGEPPDAVPPCAIEGILHTLVDTHVVIGEHPPQGEVGYVEVLSNLLTELRRLEGLLDLYLAHRGGVCARRDTVLDELPEADDCLLDIGRSRLIGCLPIPRVVLLGVEELHRGIKAISPRTP